jgi:type IV pilus assembly protein PilW
MVKLPSSNKGFTLIELLVSLGIFSIVTAGIAFAYQTQLRSYYTQRELVDIQQNIRAAMYLIEKELKLAGLDPTGKAGAGISVANANTISFSMDFNGGQKDGIDNSLNGVIDEGSDGIDNNGNGLIDEPDEAEWYNGSTADANELVTYSLSNDTNADGINDGLPTGAVCNLLRNGQILAPNFDALNFVYLDKDGAVLPTPVDTTAIRSVQVSLVARSAAKISGLGFSYVNTESYNNQQPGGAQVILPAQNDNYRRISLTCEIKCRNMGLK